MFTLSFSDWLILSFFRQWFIFRIHQPLTDEFTDDPDQANSRSLNGDIAASVPSRVYPSVRRSSARMTTKIRIRHSHRIKSQRRDDYKQRQHHPHPRDARHMIRIRCQFLAFTCASSPASGARVRMRHPRMRSPFYGSH